MAKRRVPPFKAASDLDEETYQRVHPPAETGTTRVPPIGSPPPASPHPVREPTQPEPSPPHQGSTQPVSAPKASVQASPTKLVQSRSDAREPPTKKRPPSKKRPKQELIAKTVRLPPHIYELLKELSVRLGCDQTTAIKQSIIRMHKETQPPNPR